MRKLLAGGGGELVNYDYYDVAEGTGIKNFYGAQASYVVASGATNSATKYFLTTDNTIYSNRITEKALSDDGDVWELRSNANYDVTFNMPKIVHGQARCSFTFGGITVANMTSVMVETFLYHYDGSVSSLMASGATRLLSWANGTSGATVCIPYDLTGQRWNFKQGDTLRLKMKLWTSGAVANAYMGYGCDPADRDDINDLSGAIIIPSDKTTQLKLQVPFIIDL